MRQPPKRAGRVRTETKRAASALYWMVWPAVIAFAAFHTLPVLVGHLLQLHELRRLRRVELRGIVELLQPLPGRPSAAGVRILVPLRHRRDDPDERLLARDRARIERQDQGAQLLARRLLRALHPGDPGHRLRVPVLLLELAAEDPLGHSAVRRQHPRQRAVGVDGDRGARRMAGLRVRDHHLPVGPADDPGGDVRGGIVGRRLRVAAVHVDHLPADRRVLHDQRRDQPEGLPAGVRSRSSPSPTAARARPPNR